MIGITFQLLYAVFVVGVCGYLLSRGITHLFVMLFAIATILHAVPGAAFILLSQQPGGVPAHLPIVSALSVLGGIGTVAAAAAFISLAMYLLNTATPQS